jgi:hypothetical protein
MPVAGFPTVFKKILQNELAIARSTNMSSFLSLWGDIEREPELKAQLVRQLFQPTISQVEDFYRSRVAAGEFRRLDPAVAVRAMPAMTIGLTVLDKFEGDESPLRRLPEDELADRIIDILLNGLLSRERKDEK